MKLVEIRDYIDASIPELKRVEIATRPGDIDGLRITPAAFILPVSETANANKAMAGAFIQDEKFTFAVLLKTKNVADGQGGGALEEIMILRAKLKVILNGWRHSEAINGTYFQGGRLAAFTNQIVLWQDEFTIPAQYRA